MNVVPRYFQFSQNANDDDVRVLFQYVDTDTGTVIGTGEKHLSSASLTKLATGRGVGNWDESDICTLGELTMPPVPAPEPTE